jgi:serine/threonine-protein kinase HipA
MAEVVAEAEVRLWGETVGAVAELDSGQVVFEYADAFRRSGLEISPIHMPLSLMGPVSYVELQTSPAFQGLPGVLADALPDRFGNQVIRAYFEARGESERALSPVQRLLYVGERAVGALTFHPAEQIPSRPAEMESLEIASLVADARRIVEGDPEVAIPEIYRMSSSAGGMRPKAVVLYNSENGEIRSGYAKPQPGDIPAILKFDGVATAPSERAGRELDDPLPYNRVEAAYMRMARAAGLEVADVEILAAGGYAHLIVPRFDLLGDARFSGRAPRGASGRARRGTSGDWKGGAGGSSPSPLRLHQHTFGGLVHVDYHFPGASSYEEYLRTILLLGMAQSSVEEGFRRMVFNVMAINQDDHVKNLSFHMHPSGRWVLAPAYDITFVHGRRYSAQHQMRVRDKMAGIRRDDLLAVAEEFDIRRADRMVTRVRDVLDDWESFARVAGVVRTKTTQIRAELRTRTLELGG